MIFGYCRVSTKAQAEDGYGLTAQKSEIMARYPGIDIYEEAYTGTTTDRPVFQEVIGKMQNGDLLVVAKLDRLARNTVEGIAIVKELFNKGCAVHVLNIGLLEDTVMGHFYLTIMLAVAELERNQIVERTQAGKAIARQADGYHEGRPKKYAEERIEYAIDLLEKHSYSEVVKITGISRSTLIRAKQKEDADKENNSYTER